MNDEDKWVRLPNPQISTVIFKLDNNFLFNMPSSTTGLMLINKQGGSLSPKGAVEVSNNIMNQGC